jgi:alpha-beta hydrolase superfamily lysophospholipase
MNPTKSETGFVSRPDGATLRWKLVRPEGAPRALCVVVHGLAEHTGRYGHVLSSLASAGYAALILDHRGHGDSSGRRVFVERFRQYPDDLQAVIEAGRAKLEGQVPVVLLGHSMGGLIAIHHLLNHPGVASAAALSGPGLGIAVAVPKWKDALGRVMSKLWPSLAIPTGLSPELVSRDPAVVKAYADDPKVTKSATARWYSEFLDAQARAFAEVQRITLPLYVMFGGRDGLVSTGAIRRWFEAVPAKDKRLVEYPELFHEVMNEPEKAQVLAELVAWLDAHFARG